MEHDPKELRKAAREPLRDCERWQDVWVRERLLAYADLIERSRTQAVYIKDMESTLTTIAKSLGMDKPDADKLIERHAKLRKNLLDIQFSASGYCPACSGWNADPKDPRRGCTPGVHMKDCWLAAFCADFPKE